MAQLENPYADFGFYQTEFRGQVFKDEEDFMSHAVKSADLLDIFTWHRIPSLGEQYVTPDLVKTIKKAVCAMADADLSSNPAYLGIAAGISSESNDGYSVSFGGGLAQAQTEYEEYMLKLAKMYLAESGLLHRGGGEWHE